MYKLAEKTELNQISLTGTRALALVGLLIIAPRSLEEIREAFIKMKIMDESHSNDILRIDINTLKVMGCEISRASQKTNFKYVLGKHPFALKITKEEVNALKKSYKKVKETKNFKLILDYDELFKKIASRCEPESKEWMLGISDLRHYNVQMVKDLMLDCQQQRVLDLIYANPTAKKDAQKEVVAQKLVMQNDKVYLYCYDLEKETPVVLNMRRIKSIVARKLKKGGVEPKLTKVKFHLKGLGVETIGEGENIVEQNSDGCVVEGNYYTEFLAVQRILSFGADCTVLEPEGFRDIIVSKLKEMRKIYD